MVFPHPLFRAALGLLLAGALLAPQARAQCMLRNPSFELAGSGGDVFAGWNQFNVATSTSTSSHGNMAARVVGPDTGPWGVSAFWQRLDTFPGDRWSATVCISHDGAASLTGDSRAILNIEWRNAAGDLISYESFTVADASTPADVFHLVSVQSGPAPAGAVATHLLLGVIQGPGDPAATVTFDEVRFEEVARDDPEANQWQDFPGGQTRIFAGRTWRVKGPGFYGPGPNTFLDDQDNVFVDGEGGLHLKIRSLGGGNWASSEVVLEDALGYGDYIFTTRSRLDLLDPNAVLGLFLWEYRACWDPGEGWWNPSNEMDIEFSRWGDPLNRPGQFVVQPFDFPGNIFRFDLPTNSDERTSHAFRWLPDRVEYRSWRGGPLDESSATTIAAWAYTGPHITRPERARVHVNLWFLNPGPSSEQEVILDGFQFVPACEPPHCTSPPVSTSPSPLVSGAFPNPFPAETAIRFELERTEPVRLSVFDVAGREIRVLTEDNLPRGGHEIRWDGRDARGRPAASGVYFYRLLVGDRTESRRLTLLR